MLSWFPRNKEAAALPQRLGERQLVAVGGLDVEVALAPRGVSWGILGGVGAKDVVVVPCVGGQE